MRFANRGEIVSLPVAVMLAIGNHVDWHLARHDGHLGAGWTLHWTTAVPLFALGTWQVFRLRSRAARVMAWSVLLAIVVGQGLEALGEYVFYGWSLHDSFGSERMRALAQFLLAGVVTSAIVALTWRARTGSGSRGA